MHKLHIFGLTLACTFVGAAANATILTFDIDGEGNQQMIPLAYGDHVGGGGGGDNPIFHYGAGGGGTAHIGIDYWTNDTSDNPYDHELKFFATGYGDLTDVAYMSVTGGYAHIQFNPDPGYAVTVNSFDFADWLENESGILQIVDPNKNVLWSYSGFKVPHSGHALFAPNFVSLGPIAVEWAHSWNMGIDNVSFSETPYLTDVPTAYSITAGKYVSGNLASLANKDANDLVVQSGPSFGNGDPPLSIVITGVSSVANPAALGMQLTGHANSVDLAETVEFYDYVANAWTLVYSTTATTTDSSVTPLTTDSSRFVQSGTLQMKARLAWKPAGPISKSPWSVFVDQAVWNVV